MRRLPQIRLRTLFLVFFCAAIGLTIGTQSEPANYTSLLVGRHRLNLDWLYALLSASSVAVVIGLGRQALQLCRLEVTSQPEVYALRFARQFAIIWRVAIAAIVSLCLLTVLLLAKQFVKLPESDMLFAYEVFPFAVWIFCIIVVLMASISRFTPTKHPARMDGTISIVLWLAVAILVAMMLPNNGLILYLVHIATEGIEAAQPLIYQRPGEFPDHEDSGFRVFWIATAAVGLTFLSLACLSRLCSASMLSRFARTFAVVVFVLSTALVAGYCVWYYAYAFHYLSPYLADAGPASNFAERAAGICLATILVTAGAYRIANSREVSEPSMNKDMVAISVGIHESILCLLAFLVGCAIYVFQVVAVTYNSPGPLIRGVVLPRIVEASATALVDPPSILLLIVGGLSARVIWLRWRTRKDDVGVRLSPLDLRRFAWSWFALALWTVVAVPALSSYCFVFWLGPWYLFGA